MNDITVKYGSVFGNYKWTATTVVPGGLVEALLPFALLQITQRTPSTKAEKAMAGYEKRPKAFKRTDIPYSDEGAELLRESLSGFKFETGRDEKDEAILASLTADVEVELYEGSAADVKLNDERAAYARNAAKLPALAAKIEYDGELGDGTKENAPVEFLRAIRVYSKKMLAELGAD